MNNLSLALVLIAIFFFISSTSSTTVDAMAVPSPAPSPTQSSALGCDNKCVKRCANAGYHERCMKYCGICCGKCEGCVPSSPYADKAECPCYRDLKNSKGKDKCP